MSEKDVIQTSRMVTFILGLISIAIAIWIQDILVALDMAYAILSGAIFIPLVLGLYWKRVTNKAAFYSIIASTTVIFVSFAIFGIASTYPILLGITTSVIVIVTTTLLDTANAPETNPYEQIEKASIK